MGKGKGDKTKVEKAKGRKKVMKKAGKKGKTAKAKRKAVTKKVSKGSKKGKVQRKEKKKKVEKKGKVAGKKKPITKRAKVEVRKRGEKVGKKRKERKSTKKVATKGVSKRSKAKRKAVTKKVSKGSKKGKVQRKEKKKKVEKKGKVAGKKAVKRKTGKTVKKMKTSAKRAASKKESKKSKAKVKKVGGKAGKKKVEKKAKARKREEEAERRRGEAKKIEVVIRKIETQKRKEEPEEAEEEAEEAEVGFGRIEIPTQKKEKVIEEMEKGTETEEIAKEVTPTISKEIREPRRKIRCPECGSTNLKWDYEKGELVCEDCGIIVEETMIDFGPEWRAFDSYQKTRRQRTGSPVKYTKPNKGLVTEIDKYNRDIRGTKLSPQAASQMGRLRKWHKRSSISSSIERNLTIAFGDLDRIASYLGLPHNIREAAALLYRKAVEKGLIRGRLIESVVAAVIYMICRQNGIPRTLDEIAEISGISKKEIGRTYRFLKKELYVDVPLTNPIHYVPRFASALNLSGEVQEKAKEILQEAVDKGLISGRGPTGVAAAAVYIASVMMGERRTQKEVAEIANVTEVTIRNRYRELKRELNLDISVEDEE